MFILADSPQGAAGTVNITVTTPYGTSATSSADQFTYVAAPVAAADSYTATQDSTLTVPAGSGVLANDTDPQGLSLSATLLTDPADGTLSFGSDGSFNYTPNSGYLGPDSFTYEATDGYASSGPTTVSINVVPATMTWVGGPGGTGSTGEWTNPQQWSGADLPYPDATVSAVVDTPSVVQVTSNQTANALAISNGGEVAVGPGAVLAITTNFSVTGGGTLSVDPNGAFFAGGTVTMNSASLAGGPISAAAYQLNGGTVSADLSGPGGLTVGGGGGTTGGKTEPTDSPAGTVTLSGVNSYAGGTVVNSGTLIVANASALPAGSSLSVGAGAGDLFAASQLSGMPAIGLVASASAAAVGATSRPTVSPSASDLFGHSPAAPETTDSPAETSMDVARLAAAPAGDAVQPVAVSSAANDAVFKSGGSVFDRIVGPADAAQAARPWAWLAAEQSSWNSANQNKTANFAAAALDKVLAQYGA